MARWKLILRFDVFSLVFGSLLAVGLGFLALDKYLHNLLIAQVTLGAAGLILAAKFVDNGSSAKTGGHAKAKWFMAAFVAVGIAAYSVFVIQDHKEGPSFVYIAGLPLGESNSPLMLLEYVHFGPNPAYNCEIHFSDLDRMKLRQNWLAANPGVSFAPPNLYGATDAAWQLNELDAELKVRPMTSHWVILDPDHQHYDIGINCRDGIFSERWDIARVDGRLRTRFSVERVFPFTGRKPEAIFKCTDPEFIDGPATVPPGFNPNDSHPEINVGWQASHRYDPPAAILDPNGNVESATVPGWDVGCWNRMGPQAESN